MRDEQFTYAKNLEIEARKILPQRQTYGLASNARFKIVLVKYFLFKYLETFDTVLTLLSLKKGNEASMLSRSLYEIWVKIFYLQENESKGLLLFRIEHDRHLLATTARWRKVRNGPLPEDADYGVYEVSAQESIKELLTELEIKDAQLAKKISSADNDVWAGKSLKQMVSELMPDKLWYHSAAFDAPSELLHTNAGLISEYFAVKNGEPIPEVLNFLDLADQTLMIACGMLNDVARVSAKLLDIKEGDGLKDLTRRFSETFAGPQQA